MPPPLIVVAHAVAPGSGGAEAEVNAQLIRALAARWQAPVTVITAARDLTSEDGRPLSRSGPFTVHGLGECGELADRASAASRVASWLVREVRTGGVVSVPARAVNRLVYMLTGRGLKQTWRRAAADLLRRELARQPGAVVYSRALPYSSIDAAASVRQSQRFPWIVNINDPLPPGLWPGMYWIDRRSDRYIDSALSRAIPLVSAFTFPSAGLRQLEVEKYPQMLHVPSFVVPHVPPVVTRPRPPASHAEGSREPRLRIVFMGTLRANRLTPEFLKESVNSSRPTRRRRQWRACPSSCPSRTPG